MRKGEYSIQNFTQKKKGVTSWESKQANEISNNKESKADSTGMAKEGQDPFSLCEVEEEVSKKRRKAQREKMEKEGNQHPWNSEKRSEQQE